MKFSLLKNSNLNNNKPNNSNTSTKDLSTETSSLLDPEIKYDNKMFISKKYDYPILDKDIIEFVTENFPKASNVISKSLMNLKNALEDSIDIIEDTSSKIIKDERNFNLSARYRDTSVSLYKISNNIENYINWIDSLNKNISDVKSEEDISSENCSHNLSKDIFNDLNDNTNCLNSENSKNTFNIFSDFTDKIPKAFTIDSLEVMVDDWNDLVIKTADSLIKIYRSSKKLSNTEITIPKLCYKKSFENELRDTIIEMLIEYNIEPSRYKVIVY